MLGHWVTLLTTIQSETVKIGIQIIAKDGNVKFDFDFSNDKTFDETFDLNALSL